MQGSNDVVTMLVVPTRLVSVVDGVWIMDIFGVKSQLNCFLYNV